MKNRFFQRSGAAFLLYLLAAFPTLAFDACAPNAAKNYVPIEQSYHKGLLFAVEKCGRETNYLFATMHSDDPELYGHFQEAAQKLSFARVAGFELALSPEVKQKVGQMMFAPPGQPGLQQKLGNAYFTTLAHEVKKITRLEPNLVDRLNPWAAAVLLEAPQNKADGIILDEKLQDYGKGMGVPLFSLETIEEQFNVFRNLPEDKQLAMLTDSLENITFSREVEAKLAAAYQKKDLLTIGNLADETFAKLEDAELRRYLEAQLLERRNSVMTERMLPELESGNAFVAVGALHFLRHNGILKQLEEKGYFVTAVE